jgi:hypothetical protein
MKLRLETLVIADYHLRDGTANNIKARVIELSPHNFHSIVSDHHSLLRSWIPVAAC